jgi:multiple sugar transport system permease protein
MAVNANISSGRFPRKISSRKIWDYLTSLIFVLPALINFAIFRYYPIIWATRASFWDYSMLAGFTKFVGFGNYERLLGDRFFWQIMWVTTQFFLMYVPAIVILALTLAVFSNQKKPGMGTIRAIIFIPVVTSFVVVSIIWGMLLNRDVGLINGIIQSFGFPRISFLLDKMRALPTIAFISVWKNVGYSVVILAAGLKSIPGEFYEAAIVDGANGWQRFINITIPLIMRQLMFVTVMATLGAFQVFVPVYALTNGGPSRATNVIVFHIYNRAFRFGEMGYASAMSIVLLLVLLVVSLVQMRMFKRDY